MRQTLSGLLLAVSGLCIAPGLQAQERAAGPDTARLGRETAMSATTDSLSRGYNEEPHELTINERRRRRGLTDRHTLFVPKGQWVFGGTASYSTHTNDNYRFLIVEEINSTGYTVRVSPMVAYALHDNMALGARFTYSRSLLKLDKAHLEFGSEGNTTELSARDFYTLKHSYSAAFIWRQYIPLGRSKRFALFNETSLSFGGIQSKFANDSPVKGTYQTGFEVGIGISPGIVAFATNDMAVEVNVGVMGINYSHIKQVHNQVRDGDIKTSMMNFKVNIFSIGLGMAFYL